MPLEVVETNYYNLHKHLSENRRPTELWTRIAVGSLGIVAEEHYGAGGEIVLSIQGKLISLNNVHNTWGIDDRIYVHPLRNTDAVTLIARG